MGRKGKDKGWGITLEDVRRYSRLSVEDRLRFLEEMIRLRYDLKLLKHPPSRREGEKRRVV